jgi:hypothetical protein
MRSSFVPRTGIGLIAAICAAAPLAAQGPAPATQADPRVSPNDPVSTFDPAAIPMPDLHFTPTPNAIDNYDKYFFFNRAGTDFATAYGDLRECDGYARGLSYRAGPVYLPYNSYTGGVLGAAIGGAIAGALDNAIYGSAERRRLRRVNMRICMGFKGYTAFGLPKEIWEQFNFEEGNAHIEEGQRQRFLQMQARAASGPRPAIGELGDEF